MKYFVHYPFSRTCNLRCNYCFLKKQFDNKEDYRPNFSVDKWKQFREKHLQDAEEIIFNFVGGETFLPDNIDFICDILRNTTDEKFELLTNGICDTKDYQKIVEFKDRCHRIGFTFHRKVIGNNPTLVSTYEKNVLLLHSLGLPVYVKEMLFISESGEIIRNKEIWKSKGIKFSIQDYKGIDHERCDENNYGLSDLELVDDEYKKTGKECSCKSGYKNLIIRGDEFPGDIIPCWFDKALIGDINDNTFNPNYKIYRKGNKIDVECDQKVYRESEKYTK